MNMNMPPQHMSSPSSASRSSCRSLSLCVSLHSRLRLRVVTEMLQFDMGTMTATGDFLSQLAGDFADFGDDVDVDSVTSSASTSTNGSASASAAADSKNRNRGNYRCSKVSRRTSRA